MVQAYEIQQQFREIVGKIGIFRKPKVLSRFNKITSRDAVNPFFSPGKIPSRALGAIWPDHLSKADDGPVDFCRPTNRKCVCDLLLVRHSHLGPILHRFRHIAGLFDHYPHAYSTLIFPPTLESKWARTFSYSAVNYFRSISISNPCVHGTWT